MSILDHGSYAWVLEHFAQWCNQEGIQGNHPFTPRCAPTETRGSLLTRVSAPHAVSPPPPPSVISPHLAVSPLPASNHGADFRRGHGDPNPSFKHLSPPPPPPPPPSLLRPACLK